MNNIYHKIITGGFALVLAGAVAFTAAPMDAQASAALGISSQIGLSADMDAAETTDVENAMNQTVLDAFHLDGYSNLGIVTVSEGKVNIPQQKARSLERSVIMQAVTCLEKRASGCRSNPEK